MVSRPTDYLFSFIWAFLATLVLALVIQAAAFSSLIAGAAAGALLWVVVAGATFTYSIFEGPKLSVWAVFAGYQLTVLVITGAILGVW